MSAIIQDDRGELDRILGEIATFKRSAVKVGILEGTTRDDGKVMAEIGAVHEYGSPEHGIPERPFIRSWVEEKREDINQFIEGLINRVEAGSFTADEAMKKLGAFGEAGIKKQIDSVMSPPLRPETIRRKGSSKPLIDTGQMRGSIHYQLVGND